jgi:hypothetical protein
MDEQNAAPLDLIEWTGRTFSPRITEIATPGIDTTRISLLSEREMRYWTSELGVTIYQLRDAIKATGSREPALIREFLRPRAA